MNKIDETDSPAQHDLGVLFVHGIGEQREGRTLVTFAGAIHAWLAQWDPKEKHDRRRSPLEDVVLTPSLLPTRSDKDSGGPAHGSLRTRLGVADGGAPDRRWLLAEAWWAEVFTPPRFTDLARWLWKVSTCLLVLQFLVPLRRRWGAFSSGMAPSLSGTSMEGIGARGRALQLAWVVFYAIGMGIAAVLSVPLAVVLLAFAIASVLPIPRVDQAVQWVVVHLSAIVGDSYVLVRCPVEYAAMRTQVARDLAWLEQRCTKVVIVAHSQGAAIAHQVIADSPAGSHKLRALITIGQGISKLHLLDRMSEDPEFAQKAFWSRWLVAGGLVVTSVVTLSLVLGRGLGWSALRWVPDPEVTGPFALGAGFASMICGIVCASMTVRKSVEEDTVLPGVRPRFTWIDYYASADPVSNGPLVRNGEKRVPGGVVPAEQDCRRVYNMASIVADHTAYLKNQMQFVTRLMNDLVSCDTGPDSWLLLESVVEDAGKRRHRLGTLLSGVRAVVLGAGLAVWLWNPSEWLRGPTERLTAPLSFHVAAQDLILRLGAAILAMALLHMILLAAWHGVERRSTARFFSKAPRRDAGSPGSVEPPIRSSDAEAKIPATID
jgi:hypothetical protein